ncbi:MAG: hypothetical protein WA007_10985, partial [Hydrogenophaga sp.]
ALRRPARFVEVLLACECDARGRLGHSESAYPQSARLGGVLAAAQSVDTAGIARAALQPVAHPDHNAQVSAQAAGERIAHAIHQARCRAVAQSLNLEHP